MIVEARGQHDDSCYRGTRGGDSGPALGFGPTFVVHHCPMKAYVGSVDQQGLRWFFPEDVIPRELLPHLRAAVRAVDDGRLVLVNDEDAEAIGPI